MIDSMTKNFFNFFLKIPNGRKQRVLIYSQRDLQKKQG